MVKREELILGAATPERLRSIAARFRDEERLECLAICNETPIQALGRSWIMSREVYAIMLGDLPVGVAGITDGPDENGWWNPWLLGTTDILHHKTAFLRACRRYVPQFLCVYKRLRTYIDARYTQSLRWAEWLGCEVSDPAPFGENGALFCEVRLEWAAQ